jgi:PAS domain S-box-containing protein
MIPVFPSNKRAINVILDKYNGIDYTYLIFVRLDMTPKSTHHKLLQRQIKKVKALNLDSDQQWEALLDLVHDSYTTYDRDINHLKTVIRESSSELIEANERLKKAHQELADSYTNEVGLLNHLIDKSGETVQVSSEEGIMMYINERGAERLGKPASEVLGSYVGDVEQMFLDRSVWDAHVKDLKEKGPMMIEGTHKRADGSTFPIEANAYYTTQGDRGYVIAFIRDITERKNIEQKLRNSLSEKTTLLGEIHHRVKNNLTVIFGLLEMQIMQSDNPEVTDILRESQGRIQSMSMIHEKLYKSTHLESVNVSEYIEDLSHTIYITYHQFENVKLDFIKKHDISLPLNKMIPCGLLLNEVLTNIYKYAFVNRESGEITIVTSMDGDNFILEISDNGVGIDPENESKANQSLGMRLIHSFARQMKAKMTMINFNGVKYIFEIPN